MNVSVRQNNINNMNLPRAAKEDTITYLQEKYQNKSILRQTIKAGRYCHALIKMFMSVTLITSKRLVLL